MPEAMKKIRTELGPDAVILNSKVVYHGGIFGLFKKRNFEVIAVVDQKAPPVKQKNEDFQQQKKIKPVASFETKSYIDSNILDEIKQLKDMLKSKSHVDLVEDGDYPEVIKESLQTIINQEVDRIVVKELLHSGLEYYYLNNKSVSKEEMIQHFRQMLIEKLLPLSFGGISYQKKFINVVGPTGVGKTTTLAKMAAASVLNKGKKIAFITTDTYRIGAIDQLKTYAKILNVPISVCYNLEDFEKATKEFETYDLVFIDTAGRNFRNQQYVNELKTIINFEKDMETFLVLSTASKESDMIEIFQKFSTIPIQKLIFTKMDETSCRGALVNIPLKFKVGIAYLTNGQNVPDDIMEATPESVVKHVLGEKRYE